MQRKDPFVSGEFYHLYNRGVDKRIMFKSWSDYKRFLMLLYVANSETEEFRLDNLINRQHKTFSEILELDRGEPLIAIGAWCVMPNHFHLLVRQEAESGISKFMKKLGTAYAMYFNIKYERQGALFGGPFKSQLIGVKDKYLRHLFAYVNLNPLDTRFPNWEKNIKRPQREMKNFLESYQFSSYLDLVGKERIERKIISLQDFPTYFETTDSFRKFIDGYLAPFET